MAVLRIPNFVTVSVIYYKRQRFARIIRDGCSKISKFRYIVSNILKVTKICSYNKRLPSDIIRGLLTRCCWSSVPPNEGWDRKKSFFFHITKVMTQPVSSGLLILCCRLGHCFSGTMVFIHINLFIIYHNQIFLTP